MYFSLCNGKQATEGLNDGNVGRGREKVRCARMEEVEGILRKEHAREIHEGQMGGLLEGDRWRRKRT